ETRSLVIAQTLLEKNSFNSTQISDLIDDVLPHHRCKGDNKPVSINARVMATADAVAHLTTNFYLWAVHKRGQEGAAFDEACSWARKKIERDYFDKIQFDGIRQDVKPNYDALKLLFSL
ncbi:MAG: hypothetical protein HKM24_03220, partial [Gammaproteobacteria bacterium]|nr:hypothetical protein [Gammaproteobacteria bacterium]